jgi:hypothetical protein
VVVPVTQTGVAGHVEIPFDCEIDSVRLTSEDTCTVTINISNRLFNSFSQVTDTSIIGSSGISLTNSKTYENTTLSGWTTLLYSGNYLVFSVEVATGEVQTINVAIKGKR